jgi:predicted acetyltransferase
MAAMIAQQPGYRPVDLAEDAKRELLTLDTWAFPESMDLDAVVERPLPLSWDRVRGVRADDGELVACHASYPYALFPVPGARTAVSGLTWVGVHPGHRRRGLLRGMIDEHFARSLGRGEAVSALFAAEPAIYGRFGYGLASHSLTVQVPRGAALREVPAAEAGEPQIRIRFEAVDAERHADVVARIHASVERPGWATRSTPQARLSFLQDAPEHRAGAEPLRLALAEREGEPVGYALLRRRMDWQPAGPRGVVRVREIVAPTPDVARALWSVLVDLDLMSTVEAGLLAVDDPLLGLLVDTRAITARMSDNLWVRLLDLPAALGARRYQAPVDVVLEVSDALLPTNAGRWRLVGGPDGARLTRTEQAADLALDVRELGAAYLGGTSLTSLASAGLVAELSPGALTPAAVAFGWPVAPVSSYVW